MNAKNPMRLDANESVFFQRELEHIKSNSYDVKHKNLKAFQLIPVDTTAHAGADKITFRSYDMVGVAKIVADYAKDFPRVDVLGTEQSVPVVSIGDSYGYSIKEIRRSQMTGKSLDQRRANAARRANDEKVDSIAWFGDSATGVRGLINYPGISEYTVLADGTGSSKTWATKSADQIVRDVAGAITFVTNLTNGREMPDTLILPIKQYQQIAYTRMTDGNDKTILTYIRENFPSLTKIDWVTELSGAGAGATDRMMVYVRDPEHLTLEVPQPFESFAPEQKGMEFEIVCHSETGGVIVYYPLSVAYGDGI